MLVYFNADRNDTSTISNSISKKDRYLHYGFIVEGLYPGETVELINTYVWPGKQQKLATWTWDGVKSGEIAECVWDNGYETSNNGDLKIKIHIFDYQQNLSEAGATVGQFQMKVQAATKKASSGYGVGGASNSEHN